MATRSRTSFQKRQKEIARMEKQRDKAARRAQRKLAPPESGDPDIEDGLQEGEPQEGEPQAGEPQEGAPQDDASPADSSKSAG